MYIYLNLVIIIISLHVNVLYDLPTGTNFANALFLCD